MFNFRRWRHIRINKLVQRFIIADLFLLAGWGLISPIFAVFVLERVIGATVITIGIASAIYWISKSILQLPIAIVLDRTLTEKDDYHALVIGLTLAGLTAFSFVLVQEVWQLYLVELLHAVSFALYIPSWNAIFSRHLDARHRALEFSLDSTAIGVAAGIMGLLGSVIVGIFGFSTLFIVTALFSFVAAGIIFYSPTVVFPRPTSRRVLRDHTPRDINK